MLEQLKISNNTVKLIEESEKESREKKTKNRESR